ncbi:MAG: hypothetical protein ACJ76Z_03820 [Thermoleophilaceae bacterium]
MTRALFRALLGSGAAVVSAAVLAVVAFGIGASERSVAVMVGGPIAVALVVVVICWYMADGQAEDEFFNRFAAAHGMTHSSHWELYGLTPLLSGGDRRKCEHWMENDDVGIGWYTYEVRHDNGGKRDTFAPFNFTVSMVDLGEAGTRRFQGIYLRRKRGIFERLDSESDWLADHGLKKVELESAAFCERYDLLAERDQDDLALRQLFSPTFVVWLAEHPLHPGFELRAGALVVFLPDHCGEAGRLDWLLMAAAEISKRIRLELTQAAQAGSL